MHQEGVDETSKVLARWLVEPRRAMLLEREMYRGKGRGTGAWGGQLT